MSKRETPMIRRYWESVGGTLVEEFPVVAASPICGPRRLDAVILPKGEFRKAHWREVSIAGQDVIVVQAKASRLGMYLMGQAVFSAELIKRLNPASVRSVALCIADDSELRPLLLKFPNIEVVVVGPPAESPRGRS
jgi:hypothetical protein